MVSIVAFVVEATSDDPTVPGVAFDAALALGALALGFVVPGPLRSACTTAIVLSIPLVWVFGFVGNGNGGRGDVRAIYLLTAACYLVLYLVTWTKGRAILLAGTLLVFASWLSFEVAGSQSNTLVPFQSEISGSSQSTDDFGLSTSDTPFADAQDTTDSTATVALVLGLVFLAAGAVLDRRGFEGAATPFVAVGAFETIVGAVVLGGNQSLLLGGLLAVAARRGRRDRRRAGRAAPRDDVDRCPHRVRRARRGARGHRAQQRRGGRCHRARLRRGTRTDRLVPRARARRTRRRRRRPAPQGPAPPGGDILPMPDEAAA